MKITDDLVQLLDDHIVTTQQLSFSPFKGAFEERLATWENKLRLTQEVLEEWAECQKWVVALTWFQRTQPGVVSSNIGLTWKALSTV